jgi:hypothetical protein
MSYLHKKPLAQVLNYFVNTLWDTVGLFVMTITVDTYTIFINV